MRLIDVNSFKLHEFHGSKIPPYAILSHTWGDDEVSFQDWQDLQEASKRFGYAKIYGACQQAKADGHEWLWVDANCIDKTSSAELSEAINSMFQWYAQSQICYAYLQDIPTGSETNKDDEDALMKQFRESRWFTRGWTLQELLAPESVVFHAYDWSKIGSRETLSREICLATGIDSSYLVTKRKSSARSANIATKMSWLSKRSVSREEDLAYCMLGLFDINMPLLYGEGMKAFIRLQEEIIKSDNDHTIFCWEWIYSTTPFTWSSFLAPSPLSFRNSQGLRQSGQLSEEMGYLSIYQMTNAGLSIELPVLYTWTGYIVALDCIAQNGARPWIQVSGRDNGQILHVSRQPLSAHPLMITASSGDYEGMTRISTRRSIVVRHKSREETKLSIPAWVGLNSRAMTDSTWAGRYGILPIFESAKLRSAWARSRPWASHDHENVLWLEEENDIGAVSFRDICVPNILTVSTRGSQQIRISLHIGFMRTGTGDEMTSNWICDLVSVTCDASEKTCDEVEDMRERLLLKLERNGQNYFPMSVDESGLLSAELGGRDLAGFHGARVRLLLITTNTDKEDMHFGEEKDIDSVSDGALSGQSSTGAVWNPW